MMPILSSAGCHNNLRCYQGWGLLRQFPPSPLFSEFCSTVKSHVGYWISRLYLTGVDAAELWWHRQLWMWFKESNMHFCKIENFACGEFNERSFSNLHPSKGKVGIMIQWSPILAQHFCVYAYDAQLWRCVFPIANRLEIGRQNLLQNVASLEHPIVYISNNTPFQ